jgi:hypothetical protein
VDKVDMVVMVVLEDTVDMEVNKAVEEVNMVEEVVDKVDVEENTVVEEVNMVVEVVIKLSFIFSFIFYS